MIQLKNISLQYGERVLFDDISCTFAQNQRVGLVGRNGAGKSTLLKIIAGQIQPDEGSVAFSKDLRIAYMPQEIVLLSEKSVFDEAFSVFDAQQKDEHTMYLFDASAAQARTVRILKGLGYTEETMKNSVATLSIGWRMRLVLAQLLLQEADFYLFDEPTNHLDIVTKEWFLQFLKNAKFGYLFISHDRYYLDRVCDYIFELERGKGTFFTGNFTKYLALKEQQQEQIRATYERQTREIAQKMKTIERFRASASKAKMAQSMLKQVEKIEVIAPGPILPSVTFSFPAVQRAGQIVLHCKNLEFSFGNKQIFKNASLEIERGEKVALIAANGKGKTTFLNVIMGKLPIQKGTVTLGHNVSVAIFEQEQLHVLNPKATILEEVSTHCPDTSEAAIRGFLGSFLFSGDDVYKKISVLSGGERNRVAMVKVLLQKANFLILDEPTNHLDLYAKQVLLQALQQYQGTILFVSHDHDFLTLLATRIVELTSDGLYSYAGNYDDYLYHKQQLPLPLRYDSCGITPDFAKATTGNSRENTAISSKESHALRKEAGALENKIEKYETQLETINAQLLEAYGTERYKELFEKLTQTQKALDEAMARWEECQKCLR